MDDCLFCRIVKKQIPAEIVYENDKVLAFRDIDPQAPIHMLIIPKEHLTTLNDVKEEHAQLMGQIILAAKVLAKEFDIDDKGYRSVFNCNKEGGQAVYHIHLHLLGGRQMNWPPG